MGRASEALAVVRWVWQHPSNRGQRIAALGRATRFQLRGRLLGRTTVCPVGQAMRLEAHLHSSGASKAVYANPCDHPEMLVWRAHLRPDDRFVDVGANVGVYSLFAADCGAHVIAVEPARLALQRLRRNIALNPTARIEVVEAAAADHAGFVPFDPSGDTVAHIGGPVQVRAVTLDQLIGPGFVAGVKIDVEGFERLVLQGGVNALRDHRIGLMQLEWNHCSLDALGEDRQPVRDLLSKHGYELTAPDDTGVLHRTQGVEFGPDLFARPVS